MQLVCELTSYFVEVFQSTSDDRLFGRRTFDFAQRAQTLKGAIELRIKSIKITQSTALDFVTCTTTETDQLIDFLKVSGTHRWVPRLFRIPSGR